MPATELHPGEALTNDLWVGELKEETVIVHLRDVLSDAASESRDAALEDSRHVLEDPRHAARRAAVDIATAILRASSAETAAHSDDVDVISEGIGRRLGLSGQQLDDLVVAARLHDIGKVGVPLEILKKPAPLDQGEWATIHRHTTIGEQILLSVPELRGAARLVRHSHERWDGTGYPDRLAQDQTPLASRIVFCADAFHAIRSNRPYRRGRSGAEALAEIRSCSGTQFDPEVVEALEALAAELNGTRNGRSHSFRAARLMALLLILGVGAAGSALARSGVFPEPGRSLPGSGTATGATTVGNQADPGSFSSLALGSYPRIGGASPRATAPSSTGLVTVGTLPKLKISGLAGLAPTALVVPSLTGESFGGDGNGAGSDSPPEVPSGGGAKEPGASAPQAGPDQHSGQGHGDQTSDNGEAQPTAIASTAFTPATGKGKGSFNDNPGGSHKDGHGASSHSNPPHHGPPNGPPTTKSHPNSSQQGNPPNASPGSQSHPNSSHGNQTKAPPAKSPKPVKPPKGGPRPTPSPAPGGPSPVANGAVAGNANDGGDPSASHGSNGQGSNTGSSENGNGAPARGAGQSHGRD
jgi:hypothetical protein